MKHHTERFLTISLFVVFLCGVGQGQNATLSAAAGDRYVISAKAGGVSFVEGTVSVSRKVGRSGLLLKGDELQIGDRVSTARDGKAEILLNPGSFLRLGGDSQFEFITTSLDDLQLKLYQGSAILEVFAAEEFTVAIASPQSNYVLVQTGVYRIDAGVGASSLRVWKGAARVDGSEKLVKSGRTAALAGAIGKFDRDERDAFDTWSKERGKDAAKSSQRLKRDGMRTELMRSFLGRRWNMYDSFGLWVFDPFARGYCFLPFGYGWSSPYGYGYGTYIGWYNLPQVIYAPPLQIRTPRDIRVQPGQGNPGAPVTTANSPSTTADVSEKRQRATMPPFVRMQETMGGGGGGRFDPNGTMQPGTRSDTSSLPTYTPSTPSASPQWTKSDSLPSRGDSVREVRDSPSKGP